MCLKVRVIFLIKILSNFDINLVIFKVNKGDKIAKLMFEKICEVRVVECAVSKNYLPNS